MLNLKKLLTKACSAIGFYKTRSAATTYGTLYVQRTFNVITVTLDGSTSSLTHSAYTKLFTLNANERPSSAIRFVGADNNTSDVTKVAITGYIDTAGDCYVWVYGNSGADVAPRFTVTFVKTGSLT